MLPTNEDCFLQMWRENNVRFRSSNLQVYLDDFYDQSLKTTNIIQPCHCISERSRQRKKDITLWQERIELMAQTKMTGKWIILDQSNGKSYFPLKKAWISLFLPVRTSFPHSRLLFVCSEADNKLGYLREI